MGASSSSAKLDSTPSVKRTETPLKDSTPAETAPGAFPHALLIQGLPGAGASSVQKALGLGDHRVLKVDEAFLTTPQVFSTRWNGNTPHQGSGSPPWDKNVWTYGGRGTFRARWTAVASATKALVLCVDSTAVDTIEPLLNPLPKDFVNAWAHYSKQEQAERMHTLRQHMSAKTMLQNLLQGYRGYQSSRPVLVLCTKADMAGALAPELIAQKLELHKLQYTDWMCAGVNALSGEGIAEARAWLEAVIACPTDFSAARKAEQVAEAAAYEDKDSYARYSIKWELERLAQKERDDRFAAGWIFPAPKVYRADGSVWAASAQQLREFVVAPLSVDAAAEADAAADEALMDASRNAVFADVLISKLSALPEPDEDEATAAGDAAAPIKQALVEHVQQRERSASNASNASTERDDSSTSSSEHDTPHAASDSDDESAMEEPSDAKLALGEPERKSFPFVSSSPVVLLPIGRLLPEPVQRTKLVKKKEHWYRRKKLVYVTEEEREDPTLDIHTVGKGRSSLFA